MITINQLFMPFQKNGRLSLYGPFCLLGGYVLLSFFVYTLYVPATALQFDWLKGTRAINTFNGIPDPVSWFRNLGITAILMGIVSLCFFIGSGRKLGYSVLLVLLMIAGLYNFWVVASFSRTAINSIASL